MVISILMNQFHYIWIDVMPHNVGFEYSNEVELCDQSAWNFNSEAIFNRRSGPQGPNAGFKLHTNEK